ncbi:hypothetical protein RvY_10653 [Ramazzottius varieornatus]|uniref:Uncharacterized protein n=1 Tax=Ramazzottius varieornatus TaxID=947166 RepID=A0A1D1VHY6_RAMVA|nr:hypothetical protein RvY_10653 [Ramazzottius varieornatus]
MPDEERLGSPEDFHLTGMSTMTSATSSVLSDGVCVSRFPNTDTPLQAVVVNTKALQLCGYNPAVLISWPESALGPCHDGLERLD